MSIFLNGSIDSIKVFSAFSIYSASIAAVRSFARTWLEGLKGTEDTGEYLEPWKNRYADSGPLRPEAKEYFKMLVPRGEIGRPDRDCDGGAVPRFERFELCKWH
jgi:hypothetical protein